MMSVTQKAFGGADGFVQQVSSAFGDKLPEGFDTEKVQKAFDNFSKGKTSLFRRSDCTVDRCSSQ